VSVGRLQKGDETDERRRLTDRKLAIK